MKNIILLVIALMATTSFAQVRDIKSSIDSSSEKSNSSSSTVTSSTSGSYYSPPSLGESLGEFIIGSIFYYTVYGVFYGIQQAQGAVHDRREVFPERFSLQGTLLSGFDFSSNSLATTGALKGNWGLFGSHLRFQKIHDVTGDLNTLDWQVMMLRIPIKNLKLEYGLGFNYVFSPSVTYFEQSTGADYCFWDRKMTLQGEYRWTRKIQSESRFRQELTLQADYEVAVYDKLRFAPFVGFSRQNYISSTNFNLYQLGLKLRFF